MLRRPTAGAARACLHAASSPPRPAPRLHRELLRPSASVALHRHSNALVDILPPEADSTISVMSQTERPDVTYQVGGWVAFLGISLGSLGGVCGEVGGDGGAPRAVTATGVPAARPRPVPAAPSRPRRRPGS